MEQEILTETKNWYPDEHAELVKTKGWDGEGGASKALTGYAELERGMGNRVKMPTDTSPAEEISAFYNKLGRPESADGYEIAKPDMPEGMTYDQKFEMTMRGIAHEAGVTQAQMKTLVKAFNDYQIGAFNEHVGELNRSREEGERALKESWAGDYDANVQIAQRALKELVPDEAFFQLIEDSKLGNNPIFVKGWHEIGKKMLNDTYVKSDAQTEVKKDDYKPANPNSPEMYADGTDEDAKRARQWFRDNKNFVYDRDD